MMNQTLGTVVRFDHDQIGRVVIGAIRELCILMHDIPPAVWADLKPLQRQQMTTLIASIQENPEDTAEAIHQRHFAKMSETGWVYGEMYDMGRKSHPLVRPYVHMSPKYRAKEELKIAMIKKLLEPIRS